MTILALFFNGTEVEGREHFQAFYNIRGILDDGVRQIPFEELNAIQVSISGNPLAVCLTVCPERNGGSWEGCVPEGRYSEGYQLGDHVKDHCKAWCNCAERHYPCSHLRVLSLEKINSLGDQPTRSGAFRRGRDPNVLINFAWEGEEDRTSSARDFASELVQLVTRGKSAGGYTNYGMSLALCWTVRAYS